MTALASVLPNNDGLGLGLGDGAFPTILGGNSGDNEKNKDNLAFDSSSSGDPGSTTTTSFCGDGSGNSSGSGSGSSLPDGARARSPSPSPFGAPRPSHLRIWQQLQSETGNIADYHLQDTLLMCHLLDTALHYTKLSY